MKKICVDTDIFGWFVKKTSNEGQEDNITKAEWLFNWFFEEKIKVVIPSLVVAEILSGVHDEDKREEISDFICDNFEILQFDIISARIFSDIQIEKYRGNGKERLQQYRNQNSVPSCAMKNDWSIASCAISNNCQAIFTNNSRDYKKFVGEDRLQIYDLSFVDEKKKEIEEELRLKEEQKKLEEAKLKKIAEGELLPKDLSEFETFEQAQKRKETKESSNED